MDINYGKTPNQRLIEASEKGDNITVVQLLMSGVDPNVNAKDWAGYTPIIVALNNGHIKTAKILIEAGVDINKLGDCGRTPLVNAILDDRIELVKLLLELGADVNVYSRAKHSPLMLSLINKNSTIARMIIEAGANLNTVTDYGFTPLHYAIRMNDIEMVKFMVEKGALVNNNLNKWGNSLIKEAVNKENLDMVSYLINIGLDIKKLDYDGNTLLHWIATTGNINLINLVLDTGIVDVNILNTCGATPLILAVSYSNKEMVSLLIQRKADVNIQSNSGRSILHVAITAGDKDIIKTLIENDASINIVDNDGWTPLHETAHSAKIGVMRMLIKAGAELYSINKYNKTALDILKQVNSEKYYMSKDGLIKLYEQVHYRKLKKEDNTKCIQTNYDFNL